MVVDHVKQLRRHFAGLRSRVYPLIKGHFVFVIQLVTMALGSSMEVGSTFIDLDRERILRDRRYGGPDNILELMSVIEDHLGRYNGEIPSNLDGLPMIRDIAIKWFLGEATVDWDPFFLGVTMDLARGLEMYQPEPISIDEIVGQVPISKHGIPTEVIRDHLQFHLDCRLFCDLVGKWFARSRHKGAALGFLGVLEMILDMAHSFLGHLGIFLGLIEITEKVLNHLDRTWSQEHRQPLKVPFDQYLIINLVRTSVDLWCNDIGEIREKPVTTDLVEFKKRIRDTYCQFAYQLFDHIAKKVAIRGSANGWFMDVQVQVQSELQGIFQLLVGVLVKSIHMLGVPWSHREVRGW